LPDPPAARANAAARVGSLLDEVERIQDATWALREEGAAAAPCEAVEAAVASLRTGLAEIEALLHAPENAGGPPAEG
jgi:hypothetical protein